MMDTSDVNNRNKGVPIIIEVWRPWQDARVPTAGTFHEIWVVIIIIEFHCVWNFRIAPDVTLQSRFRRKGTRGAAVIALCSV
jgi:hypothetical protein